MPRSIRENKGPSLGKLQVKIPHQRSPYAMKFEDRSQVETERQQRCARGKAWNLAKNIYKLKEKDKTTFYSPSEERVLPAASTKEPEEREFVVDSAGACMHLVSEKETPTLLSWRQWGHWEVRRRWWRPTARCKQEKKAMVHVKELDLFVTVMLLEETPAVLSLGKLCEDHGNTFHWTSGQKNTSHQKGQENQSQYIELRTFRCPWFVYEFLHNAHAYFVIIFIKGFYIWRQQIHRKSSTRKKWKYEWGATGKTQQNPEKKKNEDDEELQGGILRDLPDWPQEFRENLVDESVPLEPWRSPEQGSQDTSKSSHELPMEPRAKVEPGSGKHIVYTHFSKDPNCDICLKTRITRASCRRRAGTVMPRSEIFGDLITADHKVLSGRKWITWKSSICRGDTRFGNSVVTILPMLNKNFPANPEELTKVLGADVETKSHVHWQFPGIWQSLWRINLESLYVNTSPFRNKWDCWESGTQDWRRDFCCTVAMRSGWKMVGGFHGVLLLSVKHTRSLVWWENTGSECPSKDQ